MPGISSNTIQLHVAAKQPETNKFMFLILQRSLDQKIYPMMWQVVTGTIESNETSIKTALRELNEETGLKPLKFWTIPTITSFYDPDKDEIQLVPVFGTLVEYKEYPELSAEHMDFKWLELEECIDTLVLPSHKEGTRMFWEYILMKGDGELYVIS